MVGDGTMGNVARALTALYDDVVRGRDRSIEAELLAVYAEQPTTARDVAYATA
jgi:hypothetical protein